MGRDERVYWLVWHPENGFSVMEMWLADGVVVSMTLYLGCDIAGKCDEGMHIGFYMHKGINGYSVAADINGWYFWDDDHIINVVIDRIAGIVNDSTLIIEHIEREGDEA